MTIPFCPPSPPHGFVGLSSKIGSNPMLVQGLGGNTSIKLNDIMWIKASGMPLSDISSRVYVRVDPKIAAAEIESDPGQPKEDMRIEPGDDRRPSIEVSFHALLPQKVVFHYHSVNALAHLTSDAGEAAALEKLSEFDPVSVAYANPGIPLSRLIKNATKGGGSKVILLRNHGMIICGDSVAEVGRLIAQTEDCLRMNPKAGDRREAKLPRISGWTPMPGSRQFSADQILAERFTAGCYFPDQAVFLGPEIPAVTENGLKRNSNADAAAVLVRGAGAYVRSGTSPAVHQMVQCVISILLRTPAAWHPCTLTSGDVGALLNWDAEKYRRELSEKALA